MILEGLFDMLLNLVIGIFSLLPESNIEFSAFNDVIHGISMFFQYVFYLFPMDTVAYCVGVIIYIQLFKILISFVKTIWELLPLV